MGTKNNPGKFDCYAKLDPDEPHFVLVAHDSNAPSLVRTWCSIRIAQIANGVRPDSDMEKVREARACADAMDAWYKENR